MADDSDWLRVEVLTGLQKLYALRLPGTPAKDSIAGTAEVWLEAVASCPIAWDQDLDTQRIRAAFAALFRECDSWPRPKLLLANLHSRAPTKELPKPVYPADQAADNLRRIKTMLQDTCIFKP
jgi:hypothetical protein